MLIKKAKLMKKTFIEMQGLRKREWWWRRLLRIKKEVKETQEVSKKRECLQEEESG